ncbi:E3 ubiquitin-protein ligase SINA-like 7 [Cardamine amara subsp. amara]|uniref:RING-type E3 ubiquitin transferase n=1 Tax=Cardamine amara subsp. amara TaxID=228776 RepID=A0ABD1C9C0_CARAN
MAGLENQSSLSIGENNYNNCSAKFLDLEALDCPICTDPLTTTILQCENGHIACSTCCNKLRNKCPSCALPIGHIRCRAMERVLEAVIVQCPNAKFGCTQKFSYGKKLTHEKECTFSLCSCPARNCNYAGYFKDLFTHFFIIHYGETGYNYQFIFGKSLEVCFELTDYTSIVMKEYIDSLLFVVQCFIESYGVYVTVSCIAPSALEVGEFSCHISTVVEKYNMTFESCKVKRIRKLNLQTPKEDFMLVPSYLLFEHQSGNLKRQALKLRICINKLNQE